MNILIKKLKSMKYASSKAQELQVENILKELNIKYTYQPNGTQRFPDFYIEDYNIELECKSSIGKTPMWNCSYPKKDAIYVFSSKSEKQTFVFYGREIVNEEVAKIYEEYSKKHKELQNEINEKLLKIPENTYKMKVFARNMFTQSAPMSINNGDKKLGQYFTTDKNLISNLLNDYTKTPKNVLEPSSGTGNLLSVIPSGTNTVVDAVEIDNKIIDISKSKYPYVNHINVDFLSFNFDKKYDLIIGNPPFFEIKKNDIPDWYNHLAVGRTNIYYLFIYKCLQLLKKEGELRFIIPSAFLSNVYSSKLREYIITNFKVIDIVFFKDQKMFSNAIQSVVILKICKTEPDIDNIHYYKNIFVKDKNIIKTSGTTIKSLDCTVKTGSLVWNLYKQELTDTFFSGDTLQVIYSSFISDKEETNHSKKKYLKLTEKTKKHIINAPFIAVQRIVGEKMSCKLIELGSYFVENHVNVISGSIDNLYKIYNSLSLQSTCDFIKMVINNTQVSKNELENIIPIFT